MIDLYTFASSNGQRAAIALEEGGLAYRVHKIDLAKGEQKNPAYLKINPAGAIPVLVDADGPGGRTVTLAQSCAILLYVAEKAGRFVPADPVRRATALQWLLFVASDLAPTGGMMFQLATFAPEKSQANVEWLQQRLLGYLRLCDERLKGRDYLADELSVADFALYPIVAFRKELIEQTGGLADLKRWAAAMAARPGVQRGMAVPG
jgi:GST-like protein